MVRGVVEVAFESCGAGPSSIDVGARVVFEDFLVFGGSVGAEGGGLVPPKGGEREEC